MDLCSSGGARKHISYAVGIEIDYYKSDIRVLSVNLFFKLLCISNLVLWGSKGMVLIVYRTPDRAVCI